MKRLFDKKAPAHLVVAVALSLVVVSASASQGEDNNVTGSISTKGVNHEQFAAMAKISKEEASRIATQSSPGKISEVSLEDENGFLVYSIEVASNSGEREFVIDAGNGKVLRADSGDGDEHDKDDGDSEDSESDD